MSKDRFIIRMLLFALSISITASTMGCMKYTKRINNEENESEIGIGSQINSEFTPDMEDWESTPEQSAPDTEIPESMPEQSDPSGLSDFPESADLSDAPGLPNTLYQPENTRPYAFRIDDLVPARITLADYETVLVNKNKDRVHNIKLASTAIEGYILKPGKTFSFNKVVGRRTAKKGYRYAPIFIAGKTAYGRGGGICQLSSTLYNAAKEAGFEIIERHMHAKKVPYIEKGKDATVVYISKDLKFKNNKYFSAVIHATVEDGKVKAYIEQVSSKSVK